MHTSRVEGITALMGGCRYSIVSNVSCCVFLGIMLFVVLLWPFGCDPPGLGSSFL